MGFLDYLQIIIIGIIEGITEWLPVSSTGHMILFESLWPPKMTDAFSEMFNVVIQLGAIMAVVVLYFGKLNPFSGKKTPQQKKETWSIWGKVVVGCLPAAVLGFLLDDWIDEHFFNALVVSIALIAYGLFFVIVETINKNRDPKINDFNSLSYKVALFIGFMQVLALIPGTSRSGVTILGAMIIGCSRFIAAEYTFYLAIPIMFGASGLKAVKYVLKGATVSNNEAIMLAVGCVTSFVVSIITIKFLMGFIKKHDFEPFGYYRIILGALILGIMFNDAFTNLL